ncbi:GMC oxidoreductase [Teredinibacter waterburyi]|uniref:GMC oxidoreductase n=1 Tax=Teredinibacter waterburyi TaxID=1500538 RepID=UPI00165FE17B|nr:GMC oxidoreductase [Teredinibacter waterburyi]
MKNSHYNLAVVGTGFASSFFLKEYLNHLGENDTVVVLERGTFNNGAPGREYGEHKGFSFDQSIVNTNPSKGWVQRIGFGGGTCWTGNTPRMHPNDFRTKSLYSHSEDWPITYQDLEPFYVDVEHTMGISGSADGPFPRSKPYLLPPHRLNALDREFLRKYPGELIPMPSARPSAAGAGRAICCANGICDTCPVAAKFQIDFHMRAIYQDPRVTLITEANVTSLDIRNQIVTGIHYTKDGAEHYVNCDLAAVGAHGIMTPYILLNSGLTDNALGRYLNEQVSIGVDVLLDGVRNYDGSQIMTGLGIMKLDGDFRKDTPGFLLENWNVPWLRAEAGRFRERGYFKLVFEEIPQESNFVGLSAAHPDKPEVNYADNSAYANNALANAEAIVADLLDGLPVESFSIKHPEGLGGEAHVQGTTRMGVDPNTSVVDAGLIHHKVRNLLALGSGAFPSCPAANPTLTLSALSVRAARQIMS